LAILKALQHTVNIHAQVKTATVYTDSRITLDSLKNTNIHTALVEEIRQQLMELKNMQWYIQFCWVKAHVVILRNETADTLAKEAATSTDTPESCDKVPKGVVKSELESLSVKEWQREWYKSPIGQNTKQYFPDIAARLRSKIKLSPKITAVLTGHGMTKAYLRRFHMSEDATCRCGNEYQSMDHILFHCGKTNAQREILQQQIGTWPASKEELITQYKNQFFAFIESIDFDDLNV